MFSVADLLDRAKVGGNIESDYRLAKVIGITHSAISGYRVGKSVPDARVLEQLCALSGDDVAVFAAQAQAERERTPEGKRMWLMVAARLRGAVTPAILAALFAIGLIAAPADNARAAGLDAQKIESSSFIHRIKWTFWPVCFFLHVRLRRYSGLLRLCFAASLC